MVNNNLNLDMLNIGFGVLWKFIGFKIKQGNKINNRKVNSISVDGIEYIIFKYWKNENKKKHQRNFRSHQAHTK